MSPSPDFAKTLEVYRTNLLQYTLSGDTAAKTAADSAKTWLDAFLESQRAAVDAKKREIQSFVASYETSDADLATMKRDMHTIRTNGPKLQTLYETEHEAQKVPELDFSLYYTKAAVLGGLLALIVGVTML